MKILSYGTIAIDVLPDDEARKGFLRDHFIDAQKAKLSLGGKAANYAVAVAKDNQTQVSILGAVGNDHYGQWARKSLHDFSVDTSLVHTLPSPTLSMVINPAEPSDFRYISPDYAPKHFTLDKAFFALDEYSACIAHASHVWDSLTGFLDLAGKNGLKRFFNPAPIRGLTTLEPIQKSDVIISNLLEAMTIAEKIGMTVQSTDTISMELKKETGKDFVVTLDGRGCVASVGQENLHAPARPTAVIDGTGAGDAFLGFFVAAHMRGKPLSECLRLANTAASLVCERYGASDATPSYEEVQATMHQAPQPVVI